MLSAAKSGVIPALSRNGKAPSGRTSPVAYLNVSIPVPLMKGRFVRSPAQELLRPPDDGG